MRNYKQARSYSEQAIAVAEAAKINNLPVGVLPDKYGVAGALSTLGALYGREGSYSQAIEYLRRSIALYQELDATGIKYSYQQADNLAEMGRVYKVMGDNNQALLFLNQALNTVKKLLHHDLKAGILNSIGLLYLEQEDYSRAVAYFGESLDVYRKSHNQTEGALVLQNLGVTYQRQGNHDLALECFRKSIHQAGEADKDVLITARQGMGAVYKDKSDFKTAMDTLDQGLSLAEQIGDQTRIAEILWRKAEVHQDLRNYSEAVALSERALSIARKLGLPKLSYLTATALGRAYVGQKNPDLALDMLAQAIEQVEAMRSRVVGQEQGRLLFFEKKVAAYHSLIELLIDQNRPVDALIHAEKAKGRVLLDILSGSRFQSAKTMTPSEREEERRLNQAIIGLNREMRQESLLAIRNPPRLEQLSAKLDLARLKYVSFQDRLYAAHSERQAMSEQVTTLKPDDLNSLVLDQKVVLLNYVVTRERCHLFMLSKRISGAAFDLQIYSVAIKEDELSQKVNKFRQMLANRHPDFAGLSGELYELLIKPIESKLQGVSTIGIIPDGPLWELPFQALQPKEDHYLIEDFSIFLAPSLSILKQLESRDGVSKRPTSLLSFANPLVEASSAAELEGVRDGGRHLSLPDTEAEVRSLSQFFGDGQSNIFIGATADERAFKSQASRQDIIHCATHGVLNNNHPLHSYLLFSKADGDEENDGLLEAREIMNLDLKADLVVLSACETARGRVGAGEGMIGMSWAFFAAGSRATVVSQWKVHSASTAEWMTGFYQELRQPDAGKRNSKADALRLAMLKMMKDRRFSHPFYWAGFILIGSCN